MFDLTSSKLLLLAVVALLVIGPKDFPILLRTIGKYVGIIRGHAKEFRAQFDEAMRESELGTIKKEVESLGKETEASLNATKESVEQAFAEARQGVETSVTSPPAADAVATQPAADAALSPAAVEAAATEAALPTIAALTETQPPDAPKPPPVAPADTADTLQTAARDAAQAGTQSAAAPAVERTGA
jgi:sec-independent protein translocase protein TatB